MYFTILRPEKKSDKSRKCAIPSNGDEITTLGGIMGELLPLRKIRIIETGSNRNKIKIARWGIQINNTAEERLQAEKIICGKSSRKAGRESAKRKKRRNKQKVQSRGTCGFCCVEFDINPFRQSK